MILKSDIQLCIYPSNFKYFIRSAFLSFMILNLKYDLVDLARTQTKGLK